MSFSTRRRMQPGGAPPRPSASPPARAAAVDVDGGPDAAIDQLAVQHDSWLPVPLNSSKITSSMRLPVSTRAVPMTVNEPPSSTLRAEPKSFGRVRALASTPPESSLPEGGHSEFQARPAA